MWKLYIPKLSTLLSILIIAACPLSSSGSTKITADHIEYKKEDSSISAQGNIKILKDGAAYTADSAYLKQDLSNGNFHNFTGKFGKNSRVIAKNAKIKERDVITAEDLKFTACPICESNFVPFVPIWEIKAKAAEINKKEESITYQQAWLELFGIPVFYTPYLYLPTPRSSRKTGFMAPTIKWSGILGMTIKMPVYIDLAHNMDFIFAPIITEKEGVVTAFYFKHNTEYGEYDLDASLAPAKRHRNLDTKLQNKNFVAHINSKGAFSLNKPEQIFGFSVNMVKDKTRTYLKKYKFSEEDFLTSSLYYKDIMGMSNFKAEILSFQGLRPTDITKRTAHGLPALSIKRDIAIPRIHSNLGLKGHFVNLFRPVALNYQRTILEAELSKSGFTQTGIDLQGILKGRTDQYFIQNNESVTKKHFNKTRAYYALELYAKWPLIADILQYAVYLEPQLGLILDQKKNNIDIPNEDSLNTELNTANIFSANKAYGYDRFDSGHRAFYGLTAAYKINHEYISNVIIKLGQVYNMSKNLEYTYPGFYSHFSDYIMGLQINTGKNFTLGNRMRFHKNNFALLTSELYAKLHGDSIKGNINYNMAKINTIDSLASSLSGKEVEASVFYNFYQSWWATAKARAKLKDNTSRSGLIYDGIGLEYKGECLEVFFDVGRNYVKLRDLRPSNTYSVSIRVPTNFN